MGKLKAVRPIIAAFLLAASVGITTTAISFFVTPVCDSLGFDRGDFSLYFSLMTAGNAVGVVLVGQMLNKVSVRSVISITGVWAGVGLFMLSFASKLWMFYAIAGIMGLMAGSTMMLCANVIVQKSYESQKASKVLGIVMAGSGVGGVILSLVVPGFIESFGWKMGYRFLGICWFVIAMTAVLILGNHDLNKSSQSVKVEGEGVTRAQALKDPNLYMLLLLNFCLNACNGLQQQVPALLEGMGFATASISAMVSMLTASLALGKMAQGFLYSKVGIKKGSYSMVLLYSLGMLMMLGRISIYPGIITVACGFGLCTTMMPMVVRYNFGTKDYAAIWSMVSTASSIGGVVAAPVWGSTYDIAGNYDPALIGASAVLIGALMLLIIIYKRKEKKAA